MKFPTKCHKCGNKFKGKGRFRLRLSEGPIVFCGDKCHKEYMDEKGLKPIFEGGNDG